MGKRVDETGKKYGRLLVISFHGKNKNNQALWNCICDCGNHTIVVGKVLRDGTTVSCGCFKRENDIRMFTVHGHARPGKKTSEYYAWMNIKGRCYNPKDINYKNYGGRGIKVCDRWLESFENFLADMGPKPSSKHSIDRFPDNDGDYGPGNTRWATRAEQSRNTSRNKRLTIGGETKLLIDWSIDFKCFPSQINYFLNKGKSFEWIHNHFTHNSK